MNTNTTNMTTASRSDVTANRRPDSHATRKSSIRAAIASGAVLTVSALLGGCTGSDGDAMTELFGRLTGAIIAQDDSTSKFGEHFTKGYESAKRR